MDASPVHPPRWPMAVSLAVMIVATIAIYCPPRLLLEPTTALHGSDYNQLHLRRIRFAQEWLIEKSQLPDWYPHELMGTPFWSNVQSFPFIPTRLPLLLMDPHYGYAVGVNIAAVLSAVFTWLFARRIGLSPLASALAGWTFACAGMFAGRVYVGHLPNLEGYLALPLMLWLVERAIQTNEANRFARAVLWIALSTTMLALMPHPQFPIYGLSVAAIYAIVLHWREFRRVGLILLAMVVGGGLAGAVGVPMLMLIQRSTRLLALNHATNDVFFPYYRLIAFIFPGANGWPISLPGEDAPFVDENTALFWDTICYVGWLPLIALALMLALGFKRNVARPRVVIFLLIVGLIALVTALPAARKPFEALPGTLLRSPARQVYITDFALAIVAGVAIDRLARWQRMRRDRRALAIVLAGILVAHGIDLGAHARRFVIPERVVMEHGLDTLIRTEVGEGRLAMDYTMERPINRQIDDVGFFDSIMLAKSYAGLMDLAGAAPGFNNQALRGVRLRQRALQATGTRLVVSADSRPDLPDETRGIGPVRIYRVPESQPRARFFPWSTVRQADVAEIHRRLRDGSFGLSDRIMIEPTRAAHASVEGSDAAGTRSDLQWRRVSPDVMEVSGDVSSSGIVRVLETWDPGWTVSLDGKASTIEIINDMYLGVKVDPGTHLLRFEFHTPGARIGLMVSAISACLLAGVFFLARRGGGFKTGAQVATDRRAQ